jgi:hypothetical protein
LEEIGRNEVRSSAESNDLPKVIQRILKPEVKQYHEMLFIDLYNLEESHRLTPPH